MTANEWRTWFLFQNEATQQTIRAMVNKLIDEGMSSSNAMIAAYDMIHGTDSEVIVRKVSR